MTTARAPLAVSTAEAAHMLGRTSQHVRALLRAGKLRGIQEGRCLRVLVASIREYTGDATAGHEAVSSRPDASQRDIAKRLRRWLAEGATLLAELEDR